MAGSGPERELLAVSAWAEDACLGLANTLSWRGAEQPSEALHGFADLIGWLDRAEALPGAGAAQRLRAWQRKHPAQADAIFAEAIEVREAIHAVFQSLAGEKRIEAAPMALLCEAISASPARARLDRRGKAGFAWCIEPAVSMPALLAPVLWSAADLLVKGRAARIRLCANESCLWLFIDNSKNGTRRWCDMRACGNRAKAQRHYLKEKRAGG
jgi:predicted RNA-binding Zn ribbon-like protein